MRLVVFCSIAILLSAPPAFARDPTVKDGRFTICAFQNFDKCRLLTDGAIRRYRLTAEDKRVLSELKRHVAARSVSLAELEKSFGDASKIMPHSAPDDKSIAWFKNSIGLNDLKAKCPECGIYIRVSNEVVTSLNYIVDGKFTLAWNRAAKP